MKIISKNSKARFHFTISDTYEAGIMLTGTEIKSLRNGKVQIGEAYVAHKKDELFLMNSYIEEYEMGNINNHIPTRSRKLLCHKKEIFKMQQAVDRQGFSLVPLKLYFKGRYVKLEIGLGKGKSNRDKRDDKAKNEAKLQIARAIKGARFKWKLF